MRAQLITLEGEHDFLYDPYDFETMDGIVDFFKSAGNFVASPFVAVGKGIGHFTMEAGRGISRGDFKRVIFSPFKGVGHIVGTKYRDVKSHAEFYYRPSKMRTWMGPVGMAVSAAGVAFPPLLIVGAALTAGGAIGEGLYQKDRAGKADDEEKIRLEDEKKRNLMWTMAGIGLLGVGTYIALN